MPFSLCPRGSLFNSPLGPLESKLEKRAEDVDGSLQRKSMQEVDVFALNEGVLSNLKI